MLTKTGRHWPGAVAILGLGIGSAAAQAAPPTPISACPYTITAPGNYVLTKNLTATGTCINFAPGMKNVGLDLQGHSIIGNGTGYGIVCLRSVSDTCDLIIVVNGLISRFSEGILLDGNYNTVAHLTSQQNTGAGTEGNGITLVSGKRNAVTDSLATENAGAGIKNRFGNGGATVSDSRADYNGYDGIQADGPVINSEANNNGHWGILGISVIHSTANNNAMLGIISFGDGTTDTVIESTALGNGDSGIATNGNVIGNTANKNRGKGIDLTCPASAFGNTAINNLGGNLVTSDNTCVLLNNKTP